VGRESPSLRVCGDESMPVKEAASEHHAESLGSQDRFAQDAGEEGNICTRFLHPLQRCEQADYAAMERLLIEWWSSSDPRG
jgi:hypothetical protein